MMFHVILEPDEDGWVVAACPALPGCISQGKDEKEALDNNREAIQAWLWAEDPKHKDLATGTLRKLIRFADVTVDDFITKLQAAHSPRAPFSSGITLSPSP